MSLESYLRETKPSLSASTPQKGSKGKESDWLALCEFNLRTGKVLVVDPSYGPKEENGLIVSLPNGMYLVEARVVRYGPARRISRMRFLPKGTIPVRGKKIGTVGNDTAQIGICDFEAYSEAWGDDDESSREKIQNTLWDSDGAGIAVLDKEKGVVMPFVESGFGDGEHDVFELLSEDRLIGFEVEFIQEGTDYPWHTPGATLYT